MTSRIGGIDGNRIAELDGGLGKLALFVIAFAAGQEFLLSYIGVARACHQKNRREGKDKSQTENEKNPHYGASPDTQHGYFCLLSLTEL